MSGAASINGTKIRVFADKLEGLLETDQGSLLRESQVEAVQSVVDCTRKGINVMHLVKPGGSGKTRDGIFMCEAMVQAGGKALFVIPSQLSVIDFAAKAKDLFLGTKMGKVYSKEKMVEEITFVTYASLLRNVLNISYNEQKADQSTLIDPQLFDLVIWDEAHMYLTRTAKKLVDHFRHCIQIGLTATPRYHFGKEVADIFEHSAYNLDFETAKERKEICHHVNYTLITDVVTGIRSGAIEESSEVLEAIDRKDRNGIVPHVYKNTVFSINDRERTLFGDATLVFAGHIDHAHSVADEVNQEIMPLLQTDETLRRILKDKGIDPDLVESIAQPIHAQGTDKHGTISTTEREELIRKYEERKILMLVSTSLLQQSFDSPQTSVVIDLIPRQTYVGAGQAGMRAMRYQVGKYAIILNFEDADRSTITFDEAIETRKHGTEEGVLVNIYRRSEPKAKRKMIAEKQKTRKAANFRIITEKEHAADARERSSEIMPIEHEQLQFTPEGRLFLNELIDDIQEEKMESLWKLREMAMPWMKNVSLRIFRKHHHHLTLDDEEQEDIVDNVFFKFFQDSEKRADATWSTFAGFFMRECNGKFRSKNFAGAIQLQKRMHTNAEDDLDTIQDPFDPDAFFTRDESTQLVEKILAFPFATKRTKDVLKSYFGLGKQKLSSTEIAEEYGLCRASVLQTIHYAKKAIVNVAGTQEQAYTSLVQREEFLRKNLYSRFQTLCSEDSEMHEYLNAICQSINERAGFKIYMGIRKIALAISSKKSDFLRRLSLKALNKYEREYIHDPNWSTTLSIEKTLVMEKKFEFEFDWCIKTFCAIFREYGIDLKNRHLEQLLNESQDRYDARMNNNLQTATSHETSDEHPSTADS